MIRTLAVLFAGSGLLAIYCMALMQYVSYAFDYYFAWLVPGSLLLGTGCGMALAGRRDTQQASSKSLVSGLHWLAAAALASVCSLLALLYLPLGPIYIFLLLFAGFSLPYMAWTGGAKLLTGTGGGQGQWFVSAVAVGACAGLLGAAVMLDISGGPLRAAWIASALLSMVVLAGARSGSFSFSALAALVVVGLAAQEVNTTQYSLPHWEANSPYLIKPILGALSNESNITGRPLQWDSEARSDVIASANKKSAYEWVITNGTAPVPLISESQSLSWLQERFPLVTVPFSVGQVKRMLSVSPLPGPDTLIARQLQVPVIDNYVYNPLGNSVNVGSSGVAGYPAFNAYAPVTRPRPAVDEGDGHYDLVFLPVTHPANAGWAGSSADEAYLYTREAMRDYWSLLEYGGMLAVTTRDELLFARMVLTLWDLLEGQGSLRGRDFVKQAWGMRLVPLAPYKGSYQYLLVAVKGTVTGPFLQKLREVVDQLPIEILFGNGAKFVPPYDLIVSGEENQSAIEKFTRLFSRHLQKRINLKPASDTHPYFFHASSDAHPYMKWLLTACLAVLIPVLLFPLAKRRRPELQDGATHPPLPVMLGYFCLLAGVLVMMASLLANQTAPWTLPRREGYSILMTVLIVGLGIGAALFRKVSGNWAPMLLVLSIALIYPLTGMGDETGAGYFSIYRMPTLTGATLLLGMSVGMTMLLGMRYISDAGLAGLLPWAWLVAGVSALAGSVLAYWLSMQWGWRYVWGAAVAASLLIFAAGLWSNKWLGQSSQT